MFLNRFLPMLALVAATGPALAQEVLPTDEGVAIPIVDTTSRFSPQVRAVANLPKPPRVREHFRYIVPEGLPNALAAGSNTGTTTATIGARFPGITFTGFRPPDPFIGVGPGHVVEVVNTEIAFFTKAGVKQFQQSLGSTGFFSGVATTTFVFDPKVAYDQGSRRWIVVVLEQDDSPQVSGLLLAISDDQDPNGSWTKYRFNVKQTRNGQNYWWDYPTIGFNRDGVVLTGNMFSFTTNSAFARALTIRKSQLLAGGAVSFFLFNIDNAFTVQAARTFENTTTTLYGIAANNTTSHRVFAWRNFAGTPTMVSSLVTIPAYVQFNGRATSTNGTTLDPVSDRLMDSAFRAGRLLVAHTVKVSSTDNRGMVRWYEFAVNSWPTSGAVSRVQSGNVKLAAPNHLIMPAIGKNGVGAISLVLTRSSNVAAADLYVCSRKQTDALGTMGPLQRLATSVASTGNPNERWGDYFAVTIDPGASNKLWGVGEVFGPGGQWRTEIASWTAGP
jgi:hypothetical protein